VDLELHTPLILLVILGIHTVTGLLVHLKTCRFQIPLLFPLSLGNILGPKNSVVCLAGIVTETQIQLILLDLYLDHCLMLYL